MKNYTIYETIQIGIQIYRDVVRHLPYNRMGFNDIKRIVEDARKAIEDEYKKTVLFEDQLAIISEIMVII
jgi:hypothetical protein